MTDATSSTPAGVTLVTGAGSGLGMECALYLASQGERIVASVLNESERVGLAAEAAQRNLSFDICTMDVTKPDDVQAAVQFVLQRGPIDAVAHFVGIALRGFFEDLGMDEIRRAYDINVFGAVAVFQAIVPHMRQRRQGRIIWITSAAARMGSMSISGYSSSKFACAGFADSMAMELYPFGIHVSQIEPGLVLTRHFVGQHRNRARKAKDPSSPYYAWFCQHEKMVDDLLARRGISPLDVAKTVHRILHSPRPRLHYIVGRNAKLIINLRRYLPGELFDRFYRPIQTKLVTRPKHQAPGLADFTEQKL